MNQQFLVASHPSAPLREYAVTLQKLLEQGYQAQGFAEVETSVTPDPIFDRVEVRIQEGPRYKLGEVVITGNKTLSTEVLRRALSAEQSKRKHPWEVGVEDTKYRIWEEGSEARLGQSAVNMGHRMIAEELRKLGFMFARFTSTIETVHSNKTVRLRIEFEEEGPVGRLSAIEVSEAPKKATKELAAYLARKPFSIVPGVQVNADLLNQIEEILWNSGRFLKHQVTPVPDTNQPGAIKLIFTLTQAEHVPPLSKPLSAKDEVCLKLCDWLNRIPQSTQDMVFHVEPSRKRPGLDVVISSRGVVVSRAEGGLPVQSVLLDAGTLAYLPGFDNAPLVYENPGMRLESFVRLLPSEPPSKHPFNLTMGAGFRNLSEGERPEDPFRFDVLVAPVTLLGWSNDPQRKSSLSKGLFRVKTDEIELRVDAATGALLDVVFTGRDAPKSSLTWQTGAFERAKQTLQSRAKADSGQPPTLNSWLWAMAEDLVRAQWFFESQTAEQRRLACAVLKRCRTKNVFAPVEETFRGKPLFTTNKVFFIPPPSGEAAAGGVFPELSAWLLQVCDKLFPQESWASAILREGCLAASGVNRFTDSEMKRVFSSADTGPLGFWAIAALLKKLGSPAQKPFAENGLTRLGIYNFQREYRYLLKGNTAFKQCLERFGAILTNSTDTELAALGAFLGSDAASFLQQCASRLRNSQPGDLVDALAPILDEYWEKSWKAAVQQHLKALGTDANQQEQPPRSQ